LVHGYGSPLCLLDGMTHGMIAGIRDQAWLDCVRRRSVLAHDAREWIQQPTSTLSLAASMWLGERLWNDLYVDDILANGSDDSVYYSSPPSTPSWKERLGDTLTCVFPTTHWYWATTPAAIGYDQWFRAAREMEARQGDPPSKATGLGGLGNPLCLLAVSDFGETRSAWTNFESSARIKRLAADLILRARSGQSIPADQTELIAIYGLEIVAAQPGSVAILYVKNPDGGFTLAADLSGPPTILGMPGRDHRVVISPTDWQVMGDVKRNRYGPRRAPAD